MKQNTRTSNALTSPIQGCIKLRDSYIVYQNPLRLTSNFINTALIILRSHQMLYYKVYDVALKRLHGRRKRLLQVKEKGRCEALETPDSHRYTWHWGVVAVVCLLNTMIDHREKGGGVCFSGILDFLMMRIRTIFIIDFLEMV